MDKLTKEQRSRNMQAIKASGSKIETTLAKALFAKGHRYRKNDKKIFGKPDLTFKKYRIAVFIDSEFWHGKNWKARRHDFKSNRVFWIDKIEKNIQRDKRVNKELKKQKWIVLRFWGKQIEKNSDVCVSVVEKMMKQQKNRDGLYKNT
jgi:DNA mismatch endonuclease Vsr